MCALFSFPLWISINHVSFNQYSYQSIIRFSPHSPIVLMSTEKGGTSPFGSMVLMNPKHQGLSLNFEFRK